jgi:hypothetical protein
VHRRRELLRHGVELWQILAPDHHAAEEHHRREWRTQVAETLAELATIEWCRSKAPATRHAAGMRGVVVGPGR